MNRLDMNLIIALEAILRLRSVTAAAGELNLTQPAVSQALRRLREHFDDPIVSLAGRRMRPTEFGEQLFVAATQLLNETRHFSQMRPGFDPASTERKFSIIASDFVLKVLFAPLLPVLAREAPGVTLQMVPIDAPSDARFQRGEVDFAVIPDRFLYDGHPHRLLFTDDFVCVLSEDHPDIADSMSAETYLSLRHVITEFGGTWRGSHFEQWALDTAIELNVACSVPSFAMLADCLVGTPYVATMHRSLWNSLPPGTGLRAVPHPLPVPRISENLQWHEIREFDSSVRWFRDLVIRVAREQFPDTEAEPVSGP
nr:LysR family transcriptional regulator [Rhodobacter sp. NTK016B]